MPTLSIICLLASFAIGMASEAMAEDSVDTDSPGSSSACSTPDSSLLAVSLRPQQTAMWCWASSAQMVMEFLGKSVKQCEQANKEFGRSDCCNSPTPDACVLGGWPEFSKYGFSSHHTHNKALSWPALRAQLSPRDASGSCHSTPFAFSWHWVGKNGGGHMMVVTGYQVINGTPYLKVNNPGPEGMGNEDTITYDEYVSGDDHTHWDDYYDVK